MLHYKYRLLFLLISLSINFSHSYAQLAIKDSLRSYFSSNTNCKNELLAIENIVENISDDSFNTLSIELKEYLMDFNTEEDKTQFAKYYYFLGYWYYFNKDDVDAIKYFLSGMDFIKNEKKYYLNYIFNLKTANSYSRLANQIQSTTFYAKGLGYYLQAIKILEHANNCNHELINLYARTGHAYHGVKDIVSSDYYYIKSGELAKKTNDEKGFAKSLLNRGNLYFRYKQLDKAEQISKKALSYSDSIAYNTVKLYSLLNLCMIYNEKGDYNNALEYANKASDIASSMNDSFMMFRSNQEKASLYIKLGNSKTAAIYFKKCIKYLDPDEDCFELKRVFKALSELYMEQNKFTEASFYQHEYIKISDSLNITDFNKKIGLAESLYEHESATFKNKLLDKDNKLKEVELTKSRLINILAFFTAFLLIILVVLEIKAKNRYRTQNEIIRKQSEEIIQKNIDLNNYKNNLEKLVKERTNELWDALRLAQESNNLKNAFLRNISHEIRTPLNAIVGFTRFINNNDVTDIKHKLELIDENGLALLNTVEKIIEFAKIETEEQYLELENYNCKKFNESVISAIQNIVDEKRTPMVNFHICLDDFSGTIETDFKKLARILIHLLENAFMFTKEGAINLKTFSNDKYLEIMVEDTGCGIAKDHVDLVFNSFHKIENKKLLSSGTGIGLAIVDRFVKALKGKISIQSEMGKGSIFSIRIPWKIS